MSGTDHLAQADQAMREGRMDAAVKLYLDAADSGVPEARRKAGELMFAGGDETAEAILREALAEGDAEAVDALSELLEVTGRPDAAVDLLIERHRLGETQWALPIANLLADALDEPEAAERWYVSALEAGDPDAPNDFAAFLQDFDRAAEAEALLRPAAEAGDEFAMANLGRLLLNGDAVDDGIAWLTRAVEAGQEDALVDLGDAELDAGRIDAAREHIRRALDSGIDGSRLLYAHLLDREGADKSEVEAAYRAAVEAGDVEIEG
ncbi:tetratricopeptide repeat protein [Embleya scabrispora]|uniref:tetratricopeptide repeat protein n=1 Tax=Embleya scabrispora TaxID=159449 RepID=UPI001319E96F|nr:tetratricopeptide repeat protein [Embleya scabrispora]MYS83168.1 hypothetical protein [Streptomyces sp. SID5474]